MLLRRITQHVKDQNWFAVFVDFLIVVVGVFIGIQVANWNDERAVFKKETQALIALRKEILASINTTESKINSYQQAADAGKRSLAFIDAEVDCEDNCWNRIVDLMHASQWQDLYVSDSSYQNMRNKGFPQSVEIIDAVEDYLAQNKSNAITFLEFPPYRSLVRQYVDVKASEFYWDQCWSLVDGLENYILDCPKGISDEEAKAIIEKIISNPNIKPYLTLWVSGIVSLPTVLGNQNMAAQKAIDLINQELERR